MTPGIDPIHHNMWLMGEDGSAVAFKAVQIVLDGTNNYTDKTSALSATCGPLYNATIGWPGFSWDQLSSTFISFQPATDPATLYRFDPVALACTPIHLKQLSGTSLPTMVSGSGVFGKVQSNPRQSR